MALGKILGSVDKASGGLLSNIAGRKKNPYGGSAPKEKKLTEAETLDFARRNSGAVASYDQQSFSQGSQGSFRNAASRGALQAGILSNAQSINRGIDQRNIAAQNQHLQASAAFDASNPTLLGGLANTAVQAYGIYSGFQLNSQQGKLLAAQTAATVAGGASKQPAGFTPQAGGYAPNASTNLSLSQPIGPSSTGAGAQFAIDSRKQRLQGPLRSNGQV